MLSHSLLEHIIVVAKDIIWVMNIKAKADDFVKKGFSQNSNKTSIEHLLKEVAIEDDENVSFHSQVIFLLKNMSFDEASIQKYLEYHCQHKCKFLKPSDLFQQEGKFESSLEARIRELLISLRETYEMDGEELFEQLSILEDILRKDPSGVYAKMDAESRATYRAVIEKLTVKRNLNEALVAGVCLELANANIPNLRCANHVGTYLIGPGYNIFRAKVLNKNIPKPMKRKYNIRGTAYFFSVVIIFILLICLLTYFTQSVHILGGIYGSIPFFFSVAFLIISATFLPFLNSSIAPVIPAMYCM